MARSNGNMSSVVKIRAVDRQRQILELRKTGLTFHEIAQRLGYKGISGVYSAFRKALIATIQEPADDARKLEVQRLDALLESLWSTAIGGNLPALDRVLAIMQRRAAYLGLDAPQKIDHEHRIRMLAEANGFDPDEAVEEARRVLRDARG